MPRFGLAFVALALSLLLFGVACGDDDGDAEPTATATVAEPTSTAGPPTATPAPGETPFPGGRDPVESSSPGPVPSILVDVRAASHDEEGGYDRIAFEFEGNTRPGYRVEYLTTPATGCGSGETVPLAGTAILQVRFSNTNAHDEQGATTAPATELAPGLPNLLEAKQTCDFEAVVVWALGLSEAADFRVIELDNPPRVAVDVAQP
jgi:hypothetical protein